MGLFQTIEPNKVKTFATQVRLPFQFTRILKLYEAVSKQEGDFTEDLFSLLRDPNNQVLRFTAFLKEIKKQAVGYGLEPEEAEKAAADIQRLVSLLLVELKENHFYDENYRLKFNCFWLEKPDILVFFKVELNDVDFANRTGCPDELLS